jgi:hypothetical protein
MDPSYVEKVQEWVTLDNQVLKYKQDIQTIIDKKREIETEILDYIKEQNLDGMSLTTSDGKIKFPKRQVTQSLSIKVLRELLDKYFKNESAVEDVVKFVSANLDKKMQITMKREIDSI